MEFNEFLHSAMPTIKKLSKLAESSTKIDNKYYSKFEVKRGLRDEHGNGVLAGLKIGRASCRERVCMFV